jgi:alpha/beta superfamily hydrolase
VNPLFFGESGRQLFGMHHPPLARHAAPRSIVLCPTLGQEGIRAHRAFRQLATQLARLGHHALRFDYHGTGDSAGDAEGATLDGWTTDVAAAVSELQDMGGPADVALVGLRFGAVLATRAAASVPVRELVLWDPVMAGDAYVDDLDRIIGATTPARAAVTSATGAVGLGGIHVSPPLLAGIRDARLATLPVPRASRVRVQTSREDAAAAALADAWRASGLRCDHAVVPMASGWDDAEAFGGVLLPQQAIAALVAWVEGREVAGA